MFSPASTPYVPPAVRPLEINKLVGKVECLAFQRAIPSLMNPTTRPPGPRPGIHVADLISRSRLANRLRALGGPPSRTQIIHQSWRAHELPSTLRPLSASWTQLSGWRHRLWTDDENRALWAAKLTFFAPPSTPLGKKDLVVTSARRLPCGARCSGCS